MKHLSPGEASHAAHDFDSISPSAYALLLIKGLTPIPYAREAAVLMQTIQPSAAETFDTHSNLLDPGKRHPEFWARVLHFESRYFSVDQLLSDLTATNILELSSGFSFRGLALSRHRPVFYIDTDLPALIATKRRFIEALAPAAASPDMPSATPVSGEPAISPDAIGHPAPASGEPATPAEPLGHYELQPLNVLDKTAFDALANRFPPGELTIVNEGLLVYLDTSEKERLCQNIRDILLQRGGCWITGDIYLRSPTPSLFGKRSDVFAKFLEQHNIEENKFESFDEARAFFVRMGFTLDREATPDYGSLSSLPHLLASVNPEQLELLRQSGRTRIHATWRLRPA